VRVFGKSRLERPLFVAADTAIIASPLSRLIAAPTERRMERQFSAKAKGASGCSSLLEWLSATTEWLSHSAQNLSRDLPNTPPNLSMFENGVIIG
jgi:hypothetical protein